ncbi:tyrosine kinase receptor Cad96Ca-like [Ptychodera flava]|uniref:tyrosine kinase receptor Cad96Ca-like n=1 Tax=Ptychodera flava TaxID=63121 RepID=UPI00396A6DCF
MFSTQLRIHGNDVAENPEYINIHTEPTYVSLEDCVKERDDYLKAGDAILEFPRNRLFLKETLNEGQFSKIVKGEAWFIGGKDGVSDVIIKVAKGDNSVFKQEIEVMGTLSQVKRVIRILGCCTEEDPLCMIIEYAPNGSLRSLLENMKTWDTDERKNNELDLLKFAVSAAECMQCLIKKEIVHREIMGKNFLVDSQWKCKLSGLGSSSAVLTDQRYRQKMKSNLPIRWIAPEVLSGNAYTAESDVWSFGVLLWEIFSFGDIPYETLEDDDVKEFIENGNRLEIPSGCTESSYQLMTSCWMEIPAERSTVTDLVDILEKFQSECRFMQQ